MPIKAVRKQPGNNLKTQAKSGAGSQTLYNEGYNAGSGFISGIGKWVGTGVFSAGWNLVTSAITGGNTEITFTITYLG